MNTLDNLMPHLSYKGWQNIGQEEKLPTWANVTLFVLGAVIALGFVM